MELDAAVASNTGRGRILLSGFAWIRPDVIRTVNRSSERGACELAEGRRDGRIEADDGAAGPVHPGSDALQYGTSE